MWTWLLTSFAAAKSKLVLWAIAAGAILTTLAALFLQAYSAGKAAEKLANASKNLQEVKVNAQAKAANASLSASDARKRLLDKWSSK